MNEDVFLLNHKKHSAKDNKSRSHDRIWIILLIVILVISIGITVWALFFKNGETTIVPDYAPQEKEENAVPFEEGGSEKMEQQEGGGAVNIIYSKEITIDLSEKVVQLMLANPQRSNQNMLIQVLIHDIVIAQSGLLTPENQISRLDLLDGIKLSPGQYDGKIAVYYYQPDSNEKAMISTDIPLTIMVEE